MNGHITVEFVMRPGMRTFAKSDTHTTPYVDVSTADGLVDVESWALDMAVSISYTQRQLRQGQRGGSLYASTGMSPHEGIPSDRC